MIFQRFSLFEQRTVLDNVIFPATLASTGKRVVTGPTEGTAIGNLIMQAIGRKEIKDVASAREIIARSFDVNEV